MKIDFTQEEKQAFIAWTREEGDRNKLYKVMEPAINRLIEHNASLSKMKYSLLSLPKEIREEILEETKIYLITKIDKFKADDEGCCEGYKGSKIRMESYYSTIVKGHLFNRIVHFQKAIKRDRILSEMTVLGLDPAVYDVYSDDGWEN